MDAPGTRSAPESLARIASPPPGRVADARARVLGELRATRAKVAVVEDDPTGTQSVRGVPLVTGWDEAELTWAMTQAAPAFAVLTNSRTLPPAQAVAINRELGRRLATVAARLGVGLRCVSSGDSTLRGHFPAVPEALAAGLERGGHPIDCVLVCPAHPEAGHLTVGDVHHVTRGDALVPVGETEHARDATFAFASSNLCDWVRERTGDDGGVASIGLTTLRRGGAIAVAERLAVLRGRARYVVVNAALPSDLDILALGVTLAERQGLRILCRTGPSFVAARIGRTTAAPLMPAEIAMLGGRGLIVAGSPGAHADPGLRTACERHDVPLAILPVADLVAGSEHERAAALRRTADELRGLLAHGSACIATAGAVAAARGAARAVADALVSIVGEVASDVTLDWLVAESAIAAHELMVRALRAGRATVLGQLFDGRVSVWALGDESLQPGLRYVVLPDNAGEDDMLERTLDRLL